MKNILYILIFLSQALFAQSAFEKGNEQYRQGQYSQAAASYESVLKENKESAELYFNLGNAYYKLEKVAPAVYNYEKALQLDPGNSDIEINLGYAHQLITDNIQPVAQPGFAGIMDSLSGTWHFDTLAWIAVVAAFLSLLLFSGYYMTRKTALKRSFFAGMCVMVVVLIFALITAFHARSEAESRHPAIVFSDMVQVKTDASQGAQDAFILHAGIKVYIIGSKGQWQKVQMPDDTVGWVPSAAIKEL
ncbi:BatE protein [Flavobacterium album]|uniref:BatE protein n=1 Tax=Flavobacterium album TaxID=2175091 RepID=A0A2S1R2P1_9FLAO|nr:tetratricopeptide repeat protein [Flavobacterium album]AWH86914.1 BatE protein [Flavobacterium album]